MEPYLEEDVGRLMDELCLEESRPRRLNGGLLHYLPPADPYKTHPAQSRQQEAEVALPCYSGRPYPGPELAKLSSPRSSLLLLPSPRSSLAAYEQPSPRSSYASTASDTSKHSSPRASLNESKPSSNRTSGISMGYDQRHASPRSSYCPEADGGGPLSSLLSPRSSISSHSSRSSRGSLGAFPELPGPSPRSSMLGPPGLLLHEEPPPPPQEVPGEAAGHYRLLAHSPPRHEQLTAELPSASYGYSSAKGSATLHRFKLPYQLTPSKESGPSPAERRLEALTLELEKELEMHMKKEYFGICIKCGKGVYGASQACQAMGSLFHTNCFTCCSCGRRLRGKAFYNVNGKVYCEEDFLYSGFQQTADKCFVCGHLIMEMILQALGKSYHPGCFRCVVCNECLDGVPFTVDVENNIYCVKDYHTVFAPKCASCSQPILPAQGSEETIRVVSMDKDYHVECYHCEDCRLQLNDEEGHRCYPLQGHLLCHSCHIRRISVNINPPHPANYPMHVTEL
ncbi:Wilms tumor protein 1-interacting protein [Pristimantis euphronides]